MLARAARRLAQPRIVLAGQSVRCQHADAAQADALSVPLEEFRESCKDFAARSIAPLAAEIDRSNSFPKHMNLWQEIGEFGLHGTHHLCPFP